jgi:hypothetical protein
MGPLFLCEVEAKASSAAPMEASVTAMCIHDRNVRSDAKKVLGSSRCGSEVASAGGRAKGFHH